MIDVETYLIKYNCPKRELPPTTTPQQIESIVNFVLPEDYVTFIKNYDGFEEFIGPEFVRLWDFDELLETNSDYQIFKYLPYTLGIGSNGSGEFIALEVHENKQRVVLSPFIDLDRKYHIEVGNSFTDFLVRLDNGQGWFK